MRGNRAYVIEAKITNGDVKKCEFWSSAKKGSFENFIDGFDAIAKTYGIKSEDLVSWEVSYAQTSLSRR